MPSLWRYLEDTPRGECISRVDWSNKFAKNTNHQDKLLSCELGALKVNGSWYIGILIMLSSRLTVQDGETVVCRCLSNRGKTRPGEWQTLVCGQESIWHCHKITPFPNTCKPICLSVMSLWSWEQRIAQPRTHVAVSDSLGVTLGFLRSQSEETCTARAWLVPS